MGIKIKSIRLQKDTWTLPFKEDMTREERVEFMVSGEMAVEISQGKYSASRKMNIDELSIGVREELYQVLKKAEKEMIDNTLVSVEGDVEE